MKGKLIFLATFASMVLATGCKQSNQSDEPLTATNANSLSVTQQLQNVKEVATNTWQKVKDTTTNAWESVKEGTTNAWADVKESMKPVADYTYEKKDAFVANAKTDLDALDQKINELSDKAAAASDSIKNEAQAKLQALHGKREELGKKFDDVKNATQADWDELKTGFKTSYDGVKASLQQTWQWLIDKLNP